MTEAAAPRRIGAILVERGLISDAELEAALAEQAERGRPIGEICVDRFGLDRLHLADALAQQWDEIRSSPGPLPATPVVGPRRTPTPTGEQGLRELLAEAQAARGELATKTDELSARLEALEALVADVTSALAEIRPTDQPEPARSSRRLSARRTRAPTAS